MPELLFMRVGVAIAGGTLAELACGWCEAWSLSRTCRASGCGGGLRVWWLLLPGSSASSRREVYE
jgi:hypothetical protein